MKSRIFVYLFSFIIISCCIVFSFGAAVSEETNIKLVLKDVIKGGLWVDNETVIIWAYSGLYSVKTGPPIKLTKLIEDYHYAPLTILKDNELIVGDRRIFFEGSHIRSFSYNLKTGKIRKAFYAWEDEKYFYDSNSDILYFNRPYKKYPGSIDVKSNVVQGLEPYNMSAGPPVVGMATDGHEIYAMHARSENFSIIKNSMVERVVQVYDEYLKVDVVDLVSAKEKVYIIGKNGQEHYFLYLYTYPCGYTKLLENQGGMGVAYAMDVNQLYVCLATDSRFPKLSIWEINDSGELKLINNSDSLELHSSSPEGDKLLVFTSRTDERNNVKDDANILYMRRK